MAVCVNSIPSPLSPPQNGMRDGTLYTTTRALARRERKPIFPDSLGGGGKFRVIKLSRIQFCPCLCFCKAAVLHQAHNHNILSNAYFFFPQFTLAKICFPENWNQQQLSSVIAFFSPIHSAFPQRENGRKREGGGKETPADFHLPCLSLSSVFPPESFSTSSSSSVHSTRDLSLRVDSPNDLYFD